MSHQEISKDVVEFYAKELFEKDPININMTWHAEFVERGLPLKIQAGDAKRDDFRAMARKELENDPTLLQNTCLLVKKRRFKQ